MCALFQRPTLVQSQSLQSIHVCVIVGPTHNTIWHTLYQAQGFPQLRTVLRQKQTPNFLTLLRPQTTPTTTTPCTPTPPKHIYTKYNIRRSQLLVSTCPQQNSISRIATIHTKFHLGGWLLLHQIRRPIWTCRPANPPLVLNQIIQPAKQCQLRLPLIATHILPQAGIIPAVAAVTLHLYCIYLLQASSMAYLLLETQMKPSPQRRPTPGWDWHQQHH